MQVVETISRLRRNPRGVAFEFEHQVADLLEVLAKDAMRYRWMAAQSPKHLAEALKGRVIMDAVIDAEIGIDKTIGQLPSQVEYLG